MGPPAPHPHIDFHFLVPSFYHSVVQAAAEEDVDIRVVFRTFGSDLPMVRASL